jgi:ribonucleotide monophosphatase NagD (HAD superfamily)
MSEFFYDRGLSIDENKILTSGLLLQDYFLQNKLQGQRTLVLGTTESHHYVERAGGIVVPSGTSPDNIDTIVICDEDGFPFVPTVDHTLSTIIHKIDHQQPISLILSNPDLYYPRGPSFFGITSGIIASMIEKIIFERYHGDCYKTITPTFVNLGKPETLLFEKAFQREKLLSPSLDKKRVIMIGDQLKTDILGANNFGIASALVGTGVGHISPFLTGTAESYSFLPDHLIPTLILKQGLMV